MPASDQLAWNDVLDTLRSEHASICRHWFEQLEPLDIGGGVMRVRAPSTNARSYLERECADAFTDTLRTLTGRLITVEFLGPSDQDPDADLHSEPLDHSANTHNAQPLAQKHPQGQAQGHNQGHTKPPAEPPIAREPQLTPPPEGAAALGQKLAPRSAPPAFRASVRSASRTHAADSYGDALIISPDYSFDNFVVGPENRLAHAAALAVAAAPGQTYNPLFVHGGVGLGKSHLLQAICLKVLGDAEREGLGRRPVIHYASCEAFSTAYFEAVQAGLMNEFRHRFRDVDVLVIDDIHFLSQRERTQEEFFHTFNALYLADKQIVLSSDAPPQEIPDLEARLVSRFQSGLVVEVNPPGYETRVQIAKQKARIRSIDLPDDVACYIAERVVSNIRKIEGAISSIHMQSVADRAPISLEIARLALNDTTTEPKPEVTISTIMGFVSEHYGVKITDLQSKRRQKSIAHPRQVCMYLAREHTRYSLEEIGGYFGGRDHTTVMHAVKTVKSKREQDDEFGRVLAALERKCNITRP